MHTYRTVLETIDLRSFSNLWFWIALAVTWSTSSHWVLGVPYDMIQRARRHGGQMEADLEDIVRINVNRVLFIARTSGMVLSGMACFIFSTLAITGFYYGIELAQAIFLLAFPMSFVGMLSISSAHKIEMRDSKGDRLYRRLRLHRFVTQLIGMLAIFVTAMWGMYQNLHFGALGH